jgi:hypothetical protein
MATTRSALSHPLDRPELCRSMPCGGRGRPRERGYPQGPSTLAALALSAGPRALRRVTWRHGTRKAVGNPTAAMTSRFPPHESDQPTAAPSRHRQLATRVPADCRMATQGIRTHRPLAVEPARRHATARTRRADEDPPAHRTRLPRTQRQPRPRPLRTPQLPRLTPLREMPVVHGPRPDRG